MWCDVEDLYRFYQSPQGIMVQVLLSSYINEAWPTVHGLNVGGYGYSLPYFNTFNHEAAKTLVMMPAPMGATPWPEHTSSVKVILCNENSFAIKDKCLDRLLVVHALESTENTRTLLREAWRVLVNGGEIMIVAPNRRGVWSRSATLFGYGQPYTGNQLYSLLESNLFTPEKPTYGLYPPPFRNPFSYRVYHQLENIGYRWSKKMGGLVIIKAKKQVRGAIPLAPPSWVKGIFIPPKKADVSAICLKNHARKVF